MNILLGLISPNSAKANIGWGGNLNSHLIASCVKNKCAKNYGNHIITLQVIVNNVEDFFSRFLHIQSIFRLVLFPDLVQKQTLGEVKKTERPMASCVRNIRTKTYENLIISVQVRMFGMFFETMCSCLVRPSAVLVYYKGTYRAT